MKKEVKQLKLKQNDFKTITVTKRESKPVTPPKDFPYWLAGILFVITTLIFFSSQIFGSNFFWEDFLEYVYPTQSFAASSGWSVPFWNPYVFNGMPFFADLQTGFFYPLNRIMTLFVSPGGQLPAGIVQIIIILHFVIAQMCMYILARYWKISSFGSVISALSYSFSMLMVCHVIHPMMLYHLAWFPLIIMLFLKGIQEFKLKYGIWAGLILGFTMLSGHPQTTLYECFMLGVMFIWYLFAGLKKKDIPSNKAIHAVINGIVPFLIAGGIFAIQLLPSQELASLSQRDEITFDKATEVSLQFKQVLSGVVPKVFGYVDGSENPAAQFYLKFGANKPAFSYYFWETTFYFGVTAVILGLFGLAIFYRRREVMLLGVLALFGFLFALGKNSFLFGIFFDLPLFGSFRNPGRIMFYVILAFSIFAGMGFDGLWQKVEAKKYMLKFLLAGIIPFFIALLVGTGTVFGALETPEAVRPLIQNYGTYAIIFCAIVIICSFMIHKGLLNTEIGAVVLVAVIIIDLYMAGVSFNQSKINPKDKYKINEQLNENVSKFQPKPPSDLFRVSMRLYSQGFMAMARNQGMLDRVMLVEGYNPLILQRVLPPTFGGLNKEQARQQLHDMYNVKYEIGQDSLGRILGFVERKTLLPRAYMVHNAIKVKPEEVELTMKNQKIDYKQQVVIEDEPETALPQSNQPNPNDKVTIETYEDNKIICKSNSSEAGILCFSEIWYPDWKVYVDGKSAKMLRTNYCFRGVSVPQGEHTIEMVYESDSFKTGMYISLITLFASVIGLVLLRKQK